MLLTTALAALVALPVGFVVSQAIGEGEEEAHHHLLETPAQVEYPVKQKEAVEATYAAGEEAALPEPVVPGRTLAFIPHSMPASVVQRCEEEIRERGAEPLCELIILHDQGKIRSGTFSPREVKEALGSNSGAAQSDSR